MPTYEFRCPEGHEFEKFYRSIGGAESTAACPVCGEIAERMMSAAGFAFKGSGFYLTDYGKNAHRGEAPADAKAKASASESGSSPEKPETVRSESGSSSSDSSKAESSKSAEPAKPAPEAKKTESKSTEAKPASTPKPSAGE